MYHSFLFESSTPLILVNSQSQPDYVNEAELGTTTHIQISVLSAKYAKLGLEKEEKSSGETQ